MSNRGCWLTMVLRCWWQCENKVETFMDIFGVDERGKKEGGRRQAMDGKVKVMTREGTN